MFSKSLSWYNVLSVAVLIEEDVMSVMSPKFGRCAGGRGIDIADVESPNLLETESGEQHSSSLEDRSSNLKMAHTVSRALIRC
jgi:hypothetical protein